MWIEVGGKPRLPLSPLLAKVKESPPPPIDFYTGVYSKSLIVMGSPSPDLLSAETEGSD